jgi:predicted nuclease with TOPRIM domain
VAIHHLSHQDVAQWIDKTNRYTSRLDRERAPDDGRSLAGFARGRIDYWLSRTRGASPGGYPEAVSVLRATYDLVDRLKTWEEERGLNAAAEFLRICASLDAQYRALGVVRDREGETVTAALYSPRTVDEHEALRRRLTHLRARHDALTAERDSHAAEAARLASELESLAKAHDETRGAMQAERLRAEQAMAESARAQAEAIAQRQRAERTEACLGSLQDELRVLQRDHDVLRGSLHTFLRGYLPRLRRHLLGQRP